MEISSSPPLTDLVREDLVSWHGQDVEDQHYPEVHGLEQPISGEQGEPEADGQFDYVVFETEERNGLEERQETEREGNKGSEEETRGNDETECEDLGIGSSECEDGGRGDTEEEDRLTSEHEAWGLDLLHSDLSHGPHGEGLHSDCQLTDGHFSDCLQAELAVVNSDSDAGEDQWDASEPANKKEGVCDGDENEEMSRDRADDDDDDHDDEEEDTRSSKDFDLRSGSVSSTDTDRKVPADFCVQQETYSVNVSNEHVDFVSARQQWRKMEEEVKGQPLPTPGLRAQGSFQGTHSSLYPPTRSPRPKHREIHAVLPREPPLPSGLEDSSYRGPLEEPETAVEREIRLTLDREERHRRERGTMPRPASLQTGRSPPRPPACRTPTLSISPSPSCSSSHPRSVYHEMTANNVIILEPDCSGSASRSCLLSSAVAGLSDWPTSLDTVPSTNVIVVETSNLIIRSASEFCLSSAPVSMETQESTFSSNPFFKLRSLSSQSLVEQEIRMVRQREEEWRKQREHMWRRTDRESYHTVLVSPGLNDSINYTVQGVPDRCVSSPSSPSRTRKKEQSSLSCDHKSPPPLSLAPRRHNNMAQRWEASLLANQKKE